MLVAERVLNFTTFLFHFETLTSHRVLTFIPKKISHVSGKRYTQAEPLHDAFAINADRTKDVTTCCSVTNADICHGVYSLCLGHAKGPLCMLTLTHTLSTPSLKCGYKIVFGNFLSLSFMQQQEILGC